ncbi:hypothetical protein GJ744_012391 [Endocarpon pusillum]|uniref:Uncharacterized protein n=1 Tax=Endocarpon pusillum TaxID=364733 RepID=A0A8H7AD99_9EURO|nr:hypothetical protein GJ744_012391 [Endocarpon pusillum]
MAASVAKRDTGRARRGHDKPDQQPVRSDRSSHKRPYSAKDEDEDKETIAYRRKRPEFKRSSTKTTKNTCKE